MTIAFIGGGHMTTALVAGMTAANFLPGDIVVADRNADKRRQLESCFGVRTVAAQDELSDAVEILILAVKPADIGDVCAQVRQQNAIILSVAAGISLRDICRRLPLSPLAVARIMPNTPFAAAAGMSVCYAETITAAAKSRINELFTCAGKVLWLSEETMLTAATAISGSGPAYVYYFAEAMEEAAQKMGFDAATARLLVIQTLCGGAAILANSDKSAAELCRAVATPGGTTERAIATLQSHALKETIGKAMQDSRQRAEEIGKLHEKREESGD